MKGSKLGSIVGWFCVGIGALYLVAASMSLYLGWPSSRESWGFVTLGLGYGFYGVITGVGLLRRRNWARWAFIVIAVLLPLASLLAALFAPFPDDFLRLTGDHLSPLAIRLLMVVCQVPLYILLFWLAKRLASEHYEVQGA